jgi:hypothetical protein
MIGLLPKIARGFAGKRVEAYRAGIRAKNFIVRKVFYALSPLVARERSEFVSVGKPTIFLMK